MKKFIVRRVLLGAMILFFVSMIIYSIERALPTSYVEGRARDMSMKQGAKPYDELVEELNAAYGLDKPVLEGYFIWLGKAVHGEFGESWIFHQPVKQKFASVIWYSFALALASFLLEIIIAIPLGIISATKQYSRIDYAVTVFALIGISLPSFFFATILKWIFSINLKWVDLYGIVSRMHDYADYRKCWFPYALYQNQYAGGSECRLYPYCQSERCSGKKGGFSSCIPQYSDSDHHHPWKYTSEPVRWSDDHRDFVPDSGNWIYLLPGINSGRYSVYHVLYGISGISDINRQSDRRYPVRCGRSKGTSKLGGKT